MTVETILRKQVMIFVAIIFFYSGGSGASTIKSDARLAMREAEAISNAVADYLRVNGQLPPALRDLVPIYLGYLPDSPWGSAFTFTQSGGVYHISLPLPKNICRTSELRTGAGGWEVYPRCVLTDEEKQELTYRQLRAVATACEAYAVDKNEYPISINQLVGIYIPVVPDQDPYQRSYNYSLSATGYMLSSYGRDHRPGGKFWDADTVFTNAQQPLRLATRSHFEYAVDGTIKLRVLPTALNAYYVDWNAFPDSLSALFPTYIRTPGMDQDLYSQPIYYNRLTADTYELAAAGQDGIPGTDDYEVRITGSFDSITPVFTPDLAILYQTSQKAGIFHGGLLVQLP